MALTEPYVKLSLYTTPTIQPSYHDLERAKDLMASHIQFAYKKDLQEFTLFHDPSDGGILDTYESSLDKKGKTTSVTKEFSDVLNNLQFARNDVRWVGYSQGGIIFTKAFR